ncbi:hypothetical protein [Sulfitobacter sp.]|uniref:hypothetical protein n=1 Tax=Sulfitobacter sp. TaxID=1903071 RepID=UPI003002C353
MYFVEDLRLSGGKVLRGDTLVPDDLAILDGRLAPIRASAHLPLVNLSGYLILPGIIDLHGDAFERHLAPRSSVRFPTDIALQSVDRDAAVNGVTTAWMAQSWPWEEGSRGPDSAETFMEAFAEYGPTALTNLRIQLRCEMHTVDTEARLVAAIARHGIDYVIFNNHLSAARSIVTTDPHGLAF